ncbi:MAG: enoyl-CoA hydratase [Betaproteobacteria bacterium]
MSHIISTTQHRVLHLEISRRDKKNALDKEMYFSLAQQIQIADSNPDIAVVLIKGQEDLFTSGNDIKDFLNRDPNAESPAVIFLRAISQFKKPLIAAVGGDAIGIGTTMLMHCDLVVASDNARFQLPFVNLGLCPEAASSFLLPQLAGNRLASQLLMLGDFFDAPTALRAGIINFHYPMGDFLQEAEKITLKLANKPPEALKTTKSLMKEVHQEQILSIMKKELDHFGRLLTTPASKEIFTAFLEKRAPDMSKVLS